MRNEVLDGWGATTFGGLVVAKSALAAARASLGPISLFSADRSHTQKKLRSIVGVCQSS